MLPKAYEARDYEDKIYKNFKAVSGPIRAGRSEREQKSAVRKCEGVDSAIFCRGCEGNFGFHVCARLCVF